ncbi:uncharacterized protein LOC131166311 isoform X2 [Malania oleifera]|uniref:uncharacterized protein LOC131166311 isoform X2 n=1 Tax=Malania oleifera TaxID=397392 RepID=UPI0025AE910B|nr:uncharacterized protein LOC131166311 isoform X2 [Malania oleifera]
MEASSLVTRARTAFHSAAAKAERVLTDFKSDHRDSDKHSPCDVRKQPEPESSKDEADSKGCHELKHLRWIPAHTRTKQNWQDRLKNIGRGRKGVEDIEKSENSTMSFPFFDENVYQMSMQNAFELKGAETVSSAESSNIGNTCVIPLASIVRQLAIAVDAGKKLKSMKDLLVSSGDTSPVRERASLSLSAVKSLVLREKEEKLTSEFANDEKVQSLICSLLDEEGQFSRRRAGSVLETLTTMTSLPREIHGAPPESFVVKLAEVIGSFKTLRKMALFWCRIVAELRRLWSDGQHVPGIPLDEIPDLNSCLLYQQLQVINCCVSRKRRRTIATESLDSVIREASSNNGESAVSEAMMPGSPVLYARVCTGELVLRLGVDHPSDNLKMLETDELVYSPITQEVPLLTEDLLKETEEFVLRTGSMGAGCSQLLSDMQAFKAANPGCILEDFIRWHSPPDWTETELSNEAEDNFDDVDLLSTRGQLSRRMQKEVRLIFSKLGVSVLINKLKISYSAKLKGNLWRELWETAKPVPAVKQTPLFDEDLAVEGILNDLEDISPSELFEQLFVSLLGLGFVIAEAILSKDDSLSKLFCECKDYIIVTCQGSTWTEKVDDLCQVYETMEMMVLNPDDILKTTKQPEETSSGAGELKRRFRRLSLTFGGRKPGGKDQKNSEETTTRQPFSSFFDGKSSLFSKKPPKPEADSASPADKSLCPEENDWTVV